MQKPLSSIVLTLMFVCLLLGSIALWNEMRNPVQTSDIVETENKASVMVDTPIAQSIVVSPLVINGKARGNWFFEASFPVEIIDGNEMVVGKGSAQAQGDWMTTEYVPFTTTVTFTKPGTDRGYIIFRKDNPSGLPENDAMIAVPITFSN